MHLFLCDELPASVETAQAPVHKIRNNHQPEGRTRRAQVRQGAAEHRTDYEEAGGLMEIQWLPGISSDTHRLGKQRGSGVSPALFGDFCAYKSHPGFGAAR